MHPVNHRSFRLINTPVKANVGDDNMTSYSRKTPVNRVYYNIASNTCHVYAIVFGLLLPKRSAACHDGILALLIGYLLRRQWLVQGRKVYDARFN